MQQMAGPFAQAGLVRPAGQKSPNDNRSSETLRHYVGVNHKNEPEEGFDCEKSSSDETGLPESYSEDEITMKSNHVFGHFLRQQQHGLELAAG